MARLQEGLSRDWVVGKAMAHQGPNRTGGRDDNWPAAGRMRCEGDRWESRKGTQSLQKTETKGLKLEALLLSRPRACEDSSVECVGDNKVNERGLGNAHCAL